MPRTVGGTSPLAGRDLYFRLLGPLTVERGGSVVDVGGLQQRVMLALLLLRAGQVVSSDELVDALWGESPPQTCRSRLHGLISGLRRALGEDGSLIETKAPGYRLIVPRRCLDVEEFDRALSCARDRAAGGDLPQAVDLYHHALRQWRGIALADLPHPAVREAAAGLEERRLAAIEERIDADLALGHHRDLVAELASLVSVHPLREGFVAKYMTVLARTGRTAEALSVFQGVRERLAEELGIDPSEQIQRVHHAILTGEETAPVRPPARRPQQLPPVTRRLIGRDKMMDTAVRLTSEEYVTGPRCLVLVGPGGVGKTEFATHLGHRIRDEFPGGQLYARLGGCGRRSRNLRSVLHQFLQALGVSADGRGLTLDALSGLFRDTLADRRVLVLLDDVAEESQLRHLLPVGPGCCVIATSRRRLPCSDIVRTMPVRSLDQESAMDLLQDAVGSAAMAEAPPAAAEIVRLCDGLPLAIHMVTARVTTRPTWTLSHIARRLSDDRGRLDWLELGDAGVRASIAASYSRLDLDQRRLFRWLGIVGSHEFPSWVSAALLDRPLGFAERILDDLVDVHLVEPAGQGLTGPRFALHDLVHLFAEELARADGAETCAAVSARVMNGWLDLASVADGEMPHWYGEDPAPPARWQAPEEVREAARAYPLTWFDEEWRLLRRVVRQAADGKLAQVAWPLAQHMSTYLDMRGAYDEWTDTLRDGLRAAEEAEDDGGVACMLGLLLDAESSQDNFDAALTYASRAVTAYASLIPERLSGHAEPPKPPQQWHALGKHMDALATARCKRDFAGLGLAAFSLIVAARRAGVREGYLPLFEEARDAFQKCGAPVSELWMTKNIGLAYLKQRRVGEAVKCLSQGKAIIQRVGDELRVNGTAGDISRVYAVQGRFSDAEAVLRDNLRESRDHGHLWDEGRALDALGRVRNARGDHRAARSAHLDALAIWQRLRASLRIAATMRELARISDALGDAAAAECYRRASAMLGAASTSGS
ncbi:AfsR/SARP family transcriptional regulator [Nonomuraea mesophila]|uniref:AfsR/SARP family transcriptional regulator n=1 Tax=Nonomuraea mesophila TaxID=2530382 RepID=A0A4R5F1V4_9ACTN|nr:AfsR/SARP family transcriptional regulator [Nonomuraea mesophila]TDE41393.1 AfsR/SARP family transcriptional regulator [Nonomuraea mesophila]